MLAFSEKVKTNREAFTTKVQGIASLLETNPNWLMAVMNAESGLNPAAVNKYTGASGLIQFMPDTAKSLGTEVAEIRNFDNLKQLDLVYSYLSPFTGRLNSYFDTYMAVFWPAAIGKPDNWVFETKNIKRSTVARQNPGIDLNKDGTITVAEFKGYLYRTIPARLKNLIFIVKDVVVKNPEIIVMLAIAIYIIYQK